MFTDSTLDWIFSIALLSSLFSYIGFRIYQWMKWISFSQNNSIDTSRIKIARPAILVIRGTVYIIATSLIIFTLFFPISEENPIQDDLQGVDILFLVDTSLSMNAVDAKPNRLTRFKELLLPMISELHGNRLGIIAFAGSPFLYCPLTSDMDAFSDYLRGLDVDIIGDKGSVLSSAFKKADQLLKSDRVMRNRILVFVSDGEDHSNAKIPNFTAKLIVWGFGDGYGSPIFYNDPDTKTQGYVSVQGTIVPNANSIGLVQSVADQEFLRSIARENRGEYFDLTQNGAGAWKLLDTIKNMEKNSNQYLQKISQDQKTYLTLIPAACLLFFDIFLLEAFVFASSFSILSMIGNMKLKIKSLFQVSILLLISGFPLIELRAESWFNPGGSHVEEGLDHFSEEDYPSALKSFERAEKHFPGDPRLDYNKGTVLLKEGRPHEAIPYLEKGTESSDPGKKAESYFNLGKAYSDLGKSKQALDSYRKALEYRKDFPDAKKNIELLYKKPPPNQSGGGQNKSNDPNRSDSSPENSKGDSSDQSDPNQNQNPGQDNPSKNDSDSENNQSNNQSAKDNENNRQGKKLSPEEAESIMDSFNPDRIRRKKGKGFFQPQRDKFW
jgi:Ca-activated chloride channel homolog